MKKLKSILAICLLALIISSCQKEKESLALPDKPASCTTVCLNGGSLNANCNCDCPPGYGGLNCSTVLSPQLMTVTKITNNLSTNFNGNNNNHIQITLNEGTISYRNDYLSPLLDPTSLLLPVCNPNKTIYTLNNYWSVAIWAQNNAGWYRLGGYYFKPSNYSTSIPSSIVLYNSSTPNFKFTLNVTWGF